MNLLLLGRGNTGSIIAEVAVERGHHVQVLGARENLHASALTADSLSRIHAVIDFTAPSAVLQNIKACCQAKKSMVVGTTGWNEERERVRRMVENAGIGFVHGANFSVGVNLFYEITRAAAGALRHQYSGQIFERHHVHKKDSPSGTAVEIGKIIREASGKELEITSFREGEVVGMHELVLNSVNDTIYICHDAKSRRGFAEGAVKAAEWLAGKTGFFDFADIWRDV